MGKHHKINMPSGFGLMSNSCSIRLISLTLATSGASVFMTMADKNKTKTGLCLSLKKKRKVEKYLS